MENSSGSSASVESLSGLTCAKMPAVVAWLDNGVGPSVCRALHKHGVPIVALARSKNHFQCQTRYVQRVIEVPEGDSAFIAHLASMADLFPDGAVLCPTNDVLATLINLNQERLKSVYRIATPAPGSLQLLGDKSRVAEALRRSEIIFPETWKVSSAEEVTSLLQKCRYPVIVKPAVKTDLWWETLRQKAIRADSAEVLSQILRRCMHLAPSLIVQEWIEGPDSNMYSYYSYVGQNGSILAEVTCQKLRQAPRLTGVGSIAMQCNEPQIEKLSKRLIRETGFLGLSGIQFKRKAGTGDIYFIEANVGRPTLNMPVAEAAGIEMQYVMYCDCAGYPLPDTRSVRYPGAKAVCWRLDLRRSLQGLQRGELTVVDWFRSVTGVVRSIDVHLDDPKALWANLKRKLASALDVT